MGILKLKYFQTFFSRSFSKKVLPRPAVMKYLNVAEKNDAAKNISSILSRGASHRREGFSTYNKIYEFPCVVMGQQVEMVFTSVSGHLLNYEFAANFRNWKSCNPLALFDAPIIKSCPEDYQKIKKTLEREVRICDTLIIWTDCDREGENIGFEIIKVCKDVKPNLRIFRARFSEITVASIFRALNNLEQPNKHVSDAVDVRQELDLRTGAAFTRLQTLRLQKVFPQKLGDKLISYGSCQFPTLGFVVERYKAIEEFIPEPFWKIKMSHTVKTMTTDFTWKRGRLFDKAACEGILDICKENSRATVESVDNKPKSKWRPVPLDTVEMEKTVSKKLRINAKDCMKIAEKLYMQGLISYPRTETNIFPKELNLVPLVEMQAQDNNWGPFARRVMTEGGPTPRQGKKSDQAHPPIHPTKYANNLTGNDQRLYEYIVRHFLACVHKDAQGHETTVTSDIAGEKFIAKGLVILERNYLDVYIYDKWNSKEIYGYERGDTFEPTILELVESSTQAPSLLTEAELIALMDKHGIGTDATHAEHIDTIKSREYVGLHDNIYFVPGCLGMGLVEGYNNIGLEISLAKPLLRADFENDLRLICEGLKDPEEVKTEQIEKYRAVFRTLLEKMTELDVSLANRLAEQPEQYAMDEIEESPVVMKCNRCGNDIVLRSKADGRGKFLTCTGFPDCKNAIWLPNCVDTVTVSDQHCPTCGPNVKKLRIKFKQNPFHGEPNPNEYCLGGCDRDVLETLGINPALVRNQNPTNNRIPNQNATTNFANYGRLVLNQPPPARPNNTIQNDNNVGNNRRPDNNTDRNRTNNNNQNNSILLLPGPSNRAANTSNFSTGNSGRDEDIVCACNREAVLLTVRKEGPNIGRKFYKCQAGKDNGGCDFFLWAPGDGDTSRTAANTSTATETIKCNCHLQAALKTVQKEGPNKGRQFYSCPKPMGQGCNFFKWADQVENGGGSNRDDWGGGGGSSSGWRGKKQIPKKGPGKTGSAPYSNQPRAKRKCGICGQEGHTRSKCPNQF